MNYTIKKPNNWYEQINNYNIENKPLLIGKRNHGILIHTSNLFKVDKFSGIIKLIS